MTAQARQISVLGVPTSAGSHNPGQELAPAAWREAGLTAVEMLAVQEAGGPRRDAIEARTNEIAAPIFAVLRPGDREPFLAALAELDTALRDVETGIDLPA